MSQDFEAKRRERLRRQRKQRQRLRMIQLLLSVVFFVLVIVIIVTSISKCSGNSTPEIDNSVPVTTSVPYAPGQSDAPKATEQAVQTPKYEIPAPSEGKNDILGVIKDSGQKKHVYLTFNNGPDNKTTPQILDILRRYDIKATFFMIGENIEKSPQMCARVIQEGHLAAPLSYSDDFRSLYSSKADFIDDMNKTYELINQNAPSGKEQFKIVRFPGGSFDESGYGFNRESYKDELAEEGFYFADWNCSVGDSSSRRSADNLLSYFAQNRPQLNNLVIQLRDSSSNQATVDMLERLIKQLLDEGYTFSRLDEIDFQVAPDTDEEEDTNDDVTADNDNEDEEERPRETATAKPAETTKKPAEATKKPAATEKPKTNSSQTNQTSGSSTSQSNSSQNSSTSTSTNNSKTDDKVLDTE
jgi:peptidoglycan/xylan/chitin deacetylase (PgdA/CDA1 family)